ncbi:MAG: hypothetical protein Fur0037_04900 [Planctomycetota bacterium]
MRLLPATIEVARQSLAGLSRHRMLWLLGLGLGAMAILLGILAGLGELPRSFHAARTCVLVGTLFHVYALLPWTAMFFAVQAVHGDIEDRTFQYLFVRPVPRAALFLGKWAASFATSFSVLAVGTAMLPLAVAGLEWPESLGPLGFLREYEKALLFGAAAYSSMAALMAARFRRPMIWSAAYIVGLEYIAASLPPEAGVRGLAVVDALRRMLIDGLDARGRMLRMLWPNSPWRYDFVGRPEKQLLWMTLGCLLVGAIIYARSEYDSRSRE